MKTKEEIQLIRPTEAFKIEPPFDWDECREAACAIFEEEEEEFTVLTRPLDPNSISYTLLPEGVEITEDCDCIHVALRGLSATGLRLLVSADKVAIEIPPFASKADTLFGIAIRQALSGMGTVITDTRNPYPYVDDLNLTMKDAARIWKDQSINDIKAAVLTLGQDPYYEISGVNRTFYCDSTMLNSAITLNWGLEAFFRMFLNCQWASVNVAPPTKVIRKIDRHEYPLMIIDNEEEQAILRSDELMGLKHNNQVKYSSVGDALEMIQWSSNVTRLDACQWLLWKMSDLSFLKWWESLPEAPVKNFSRRIIVRCNPMTEPRLFNVEQWQEIVDLLARGCAYLVIPFDPGTPAIRGGDMVSLYYEDETFSGIIATGMAVCLCDNYLVMEAYLAVNPESGAMVLTTDRLKEMFTDIDWGGSWTQLTLKSPYSKQMALLTEGFASHLNQLPVTILSDTHVDFALRQEKLLPPELIESSPWLTDSEELGL